MRTGRENRIWQGLLGAALWLSLAAGARAATPLPAYASRLDEAAKIATALTESDDEELTAAEVVNAMQALKRLLPASEEVMVDAHVYRVDNRWLQEAADKVIRDVNGDVEQRYSMLVEIEARLTSLSRSVRQAMAAMPGGETDWRSKLTGILSAPEYQAAQRRDSSLRRFWKRFQEKLTAFLRKFFGNSNVSRSLQTSPAAASGARVVIVLALLIALGIGLAKLWPRLRRRGGEDDEEEAVREVLGEELPDDASAADLLARASELAKKGEYRMAVRRAYIALLLDLELRGKLRLQRSKTNRDYLNALRQEPQLFPAFSRLTGDYEQIWYGERRATDVEFDEFLKTYQEVTRS